MSLRKIKIEKLLENFGSLKRHLVFHSTHSRKVPRITPSQWRLLMMVKQQGESTVKEVAAALGISSSAATQLVDGLVASGYVVRETDVKDRRAVVLTLSKKTEAQVDKMRKQTLEKFYNFFKVLNDKELDQYILLNKKIVERFLK